VVAPLLGGGDGDATRTGVRGAAEPGVANVLVLGRRASDDKRCTKLSSLGGSASLRLLLLSLLPRTVTVLADWVIAAPRTKEGGPMPVAPWDT